MADYLGTTTETISRTVHLLVRRGILRIVDTRHFEVLQPKALGALSGREEFVTVTRNSEGLAKVDAMERRGMLAGAAEAALTKRMRA